VAVIDVEGLGRVLGHDGRYDPLFETMVCTGLGIGEAVGPDVGRRRL